ncbi:MAG: hypothetical protein IPI25_00045 [Candidatus Brocadia sp.]|nr:MAG: hypothetical protein IPI25_00045 [Candidatus Brocadia sp.]
MNDKCAAGTGRFRGYGQNPGEIDLEEMGPISLNGKESVSVSSLCTVFAESEVVSLIGPDHRTADICGEVYISQSPNASQHSSRGLGGGRDCHDRWCGKEALSVL